MAVNSALADMTTCETGVDVCQTIINERDECVEGDLPSCEDARDQCEDIDLPSCHTERMQCDQNYGQCQTDRETCRTELEDCQSECPRFFPATGQTTCFDAGGAALPCTGTGHDGEFQLGEPLAFVNNGDGTITDLTTQLMWEVKDDSGGVHDKDAASTWDAALTFVRSLNSSSFAGYSDWRLPNVKELQTIVDFGRSTPSIDPKFNTVCAEGCTITTCSCTASTPIPAAYWTSTTIDRNHPGAWYVDFVDGVTNGAFKNESWYVRAVRGGS